MTSFHLLLETPETNLVACTKWMLGVYSQAWNRRRQRKGHDYQGRYPPSLRAMAGQARRWGSIVRNPTAAISKLWRTGEKSFAEKILKSISATIAPVRKRGSVAGEAASAHDAVEAERIAVAALLGLGAPTDAVSLERKVKWVEETALVAVLIRKRTEVRNRWVDERLAMGHEGNVTRAIRKVNESPEWKARLMELKAMLVSRDPSEE